jgi:hypothetical protein
MSTHYTDILAKNVVSKGYHVLTYTHILTSNNIIVSECKASKDINGQCFSGIGYADNIRDSTEKASLNVYNQIFSNNSPKSKLQNNNNLPKAKLQNNNSPKEKLQNNNLHKGKLQNNNNLHKKDYNCVVFEGLNARTTSQDIYDLCSEYGDIIDMEYLKNIILDN